MKWTLQHVAPYGVSAAPYGVSAAPYGESAAPYSESAAPYGKSAAPYGVSAALHSVMALQDTHGTSRGAWGTLGGGVLHMKNFYGLELLKNHF